MTEDQQCAAQENPSESQENNDDVQDLPAAPKQDKVSYLKQKVGELIYIFKTQGAREAFYAFYNYFKRRLFPNRVIDYSDILPRWYDPLKWEKKVLSFEKQEEPDVSVIVLADGRWGLTYNCLKSILGSDSSCRYEVIIMGTGHAEHASKHSQYLENVKYIETKESGFLDQFSASVREAKGRYLVFLRNGTLVLGNWLQSLYDMMERNDNIGMAGSKVIRPDGRMLESGTIASVDGSLMPYGLGNRPSEPEFGYAKEVDCFADSPIMVRRDLWESLEFPEKPFSSSDYTLADIAFTIREKGFKVSYQPRSEMIYFKDESTADIGDDRNRFLEKWKNRLERDSAPEYLQRDRSKFKRSILYVDDKVPMFDQHAGGKTTFNFLQILCDLGFKVTFAGVVDPGDYQPYTNIMQQMGIEVLCGPDYHKRIPEWLVSYAKYYDIAFLNRPECAVMYLDWFLKSKKCQIAYYGHDLHWLREQREYELTGDKSLLERSAKSKETEMYIMSNSDIVMSVSPEEKVIIDKELREEKTFVTPIFFYREEERKPFESLEKDGLLFVGGYNHTPNVDAVKWFMDEILPLVREEIPDIKVTFAGSHPNKWVQSLESENIHVPGYMSDEDLDALCERSLISIAPLRFGAGVKGKVVDAMHHGLPVVSTSIGIEGLPGIEECVKPCDDARSFADAILDLYRNREKVAEAYEKNYRYVLDTFGYESAMDTFRKIFGSAERIQDSE